jgi:hypothetical protein
MNSDGIRAYSSQLQERFGSVSLLTEGDFNSNTTTGRPLRNTITSGRFSLFSIIVHWLATVKVLRSTSHSQQGRPEPPLLALIVVVDGHTVLEVVHELDVFLQYRAAFEIP